MWCSGNGLAPNFFNVNSNYTLTVQNLTHIGASYQYERSSNNEKKEPQHKGHSLATLTRISSAERAGGKRVKIMP